MQTLLLLLLGFGAVLDSASAQAWDDLRVRFGMNPFTNFIQMPRTAKEAMAKGFKQETDCDGAANGFLGRRFVKTDGDRSTMLLFDTNGIIAGVQTESPKSTGYPSQRNKQFHNVWVETANSHLLTAYFVNTSIICNSGRTEAQLIQQGTGTGLSIQLGRATSNAGVAVKAIPKEEANLTGSMWTKGKCFVFMGQHYWYNLRQTMNCDDFLPYFLLYNSGKLDGFGFAMAANFNGEHFEHPTVSVAGQFFPFVPNCMRESGFPSTFTTSHVYFYKRPWTRLCVF